MPFIILSLWCPRDDDEGNCIGEPTTTNGDERQVKIVRHFVYAGIDARIFATFAMVFFLAT